MCPRLAVRHPRHTDRPVGTAPLKTATETTMVHGMFTVQTQLSRVTSLYIISHIVYIYIEIYITQIVYIYILYTYPVPTSKVSD